MRSDLKQLVWSWQWQSINWKWALVIGQFLHRRVESAPPQVWELQIEEGWFPKGKFKFLYQKKKEICWAGGIKNIYDKGPICKIAAHIYIYIYVEPLSPIVKNQYSLLGPLFSVWGTCITQLKCSRDDWYLLNSLAFTHLFISLSPVPNAWQIV